MLELRPNCECCDRDLFGDSGDALICIFEHTFRRGCATTCLGGQCPNCGGEPPARSRCPWDALARQPASNRRVVRSGSCLK